MIFDSPVTINSVKFHICNKKREIKSCVRPDDINDNFFNDLFHFPMEYSVSAWLDGGENEIRV